MLVNKDLIEAKSYQLLASIKSLLTSIIHRHVYGLQERNLQQLDDLADG